jgi:hypothetical protein
MAVVSWAAAAERARNRLIRLSQDDKIAIALHHFAAVDAPDVVPFDYADGPNGVRGHPGATAFPSALALAASFDRGLAAEYGVALGREVIAAGRNAIFSPGLDIVRVPYGGRAGQQLSEDPGSPGRWAAPWGERCRARACWRSPPTTSATTPSGCGPAEGALVDVPRRSMCASRPAQCRRSILSRSVARSATTASQASVSLDDARIAAVPAALAEVLGSSDQRLGIAGPDDRLAEAAALAADCDVAVVLTGRLSGEAMDVESLALPGIQGAVVSAVAAANPRTVLVTLGAGPVVLPSQVAPAALLHAWFPGEQFASALADVLTGRREPGGRLPITFPVDEQSTPIQDPAQYPGVEGVTTYSEGLLVGYRWYDECGVEPAFPFGHGMGYTTFEIDGLVVETAGDGWRTQCAIHNAGSRTGKAVLQIYVRYPPGADEPGAPLKGFDAVRLEAGERRVLTVDIASDDLKIFDEQSGGRTLSAGEYEFRAGFSSCDIRATAVVSLP